MRYILLLIIGCMLFGFIYGQADLTKDQKKAVDAAEIKIKLEEKEQLAKWRIKADKGDMAALYNMGVYYMYGYGVPQNEKEGLRMIRQAADKGYAQAQNRMGDFYGNIEGETNFAQALAWWRKAAVQNEPHAQYNIGQSYAYGWENEQNDSTAVYWYRLAAEQGVTDAQFALSNCYLEGKGVPQDNQEALFWVLLCFPESWNEGYDTVEKVKDLVSQSERDIVEQRAQEWIKSHKPQTK